LDVPAIFAQMRRDAVRARGLALGGGKDWIGLESSARLAKRSDVIDVDVESLVHDRPRGVCVVAWL